MKKLLFVFLYCVSFPVGAQNFELHWADYPIPDATMHGECQQGVAAFTEVGSQFANGVIGFVQQVDAGKTMYCRIWATKSGYTPSARSAVVSYTVPLPALSNPAGLTILVVP